MAKFTIKGGQPLYGSIRLGGAKNASFKQMIASLIPQGETRLLNFSHIEDVQITSDIIKSLGATARNAGERTLFIDPQSLKTYSIAGKFGPVSRASTMFIPALLHRFGKASVPLPGGDRIGTRPLDRHFQALEKMGVTFHHTPTRVEASVNTLTGTTYKFAKNSHTGTETLIMAAILAHGKTVIENAALEPEVDDLIQLLVDMGAHIRRRPGRIIEIEGVDKLHPTIHSIIPDRNAAVSYACAAIATKGDIIVENAVSDHLIAFLDKLDEIGAGYDVGNYGIRFYYKGPFSATDMVTAPHPGFMTDWQPVWTVLMTQAAGESIIHETIFPNRFQHVDSLVKLGANITYHSLTVDDPEKTYNFNTTEETLKQPHAIKITGPTPLKGGQHQIFDLRSGATMVLAALTTKEQTTLDSIEQIDRGYEAFDRRLRSMGANIVRQPA